ncbi:SPOR domain-containing protein [Clostridium sp. MB40-C1]|uniref:SPOR domain-containing protein n=1 Tax=Clostridium sp. MB40-C1 TaxID=3070996 RepID=UPI0027DF1B4B|nr:SPOR domain-containing protein [Clostridium sp. MB40-C1]WMJ81033.1 SPOR domain-containing protein [Clostridium sp. MB40-C1]
MKYTRYDMKRKNNNLIFFIVIIAGILIFAFIAGTIISNFFIKDKNNNSNPTENSPKKNATIIKKEDNKTDKKQEKVQNITEYSAIQCGVFSNKDNAETLKQELNQFGKSFLVTEGDKVKVIFGIYSQKEEDEVLKLLDSKKKEYSKIKFNIQPKDECDIQICKLIDANLQIIHKLNDSKVKAVHTNQIKEWSSKLEETSKEESNYKALVLLKNNINNLPKEISKEHIEQQNAFLYKVLNEIK